MTKINGISYQYGTFSGKVLQDESGAYFLCRSYDKGATGEIIAVGQSEAQMARIHLQKKELVEFGGFFE